jgi:hypothetical protein
MIATTIINSMSVKPSVLCMALRIFLIIVSPPKWLIQGKRLPSDGAKAMPQSHIIEKGRK